MRASQKPTCHKSGTGGLSALYALPRMTHAGASRRDLGREAVSLQRRGGRRAPCGHIVGASRVNVSSRQRTAGRERCGVRLRLAYWVAQVCHADARDYRRVAKDGWRAGEAVEESNFGAKKNRRDVDADFVQQASIQQLLGRVAGACERSTCQAIPRCAWRSSRTESLSFPINCASRAT